MPSKYIIYMSNTRLHGVVMFGSGTLDSRSNIIEICEKENSKDYTKITDWINTIDTEYEK